MNHLSDWIIPHLGRFEINHFVVPIPRNPTLLGQETSFTWRPGTGRYTKHSAHSGSYDTPQQSATSSRVRLCDSETPRLWDSRTPRLWDSEALRFWDSETLISETLGSWDSEILVLQSRFLYYGVDSGMAESIPVLQNRFRNYRVDFGTAESIPLVQNRFR